VSDFDFVLKCRDKRETNILFNDVNIKVPKLISKENPTFPVL